MKKSFLLSIFLGLSLFSFTLPVNAVDATVLYNKGIDLYEQNKIDESIETFKKAISINPDFYEAYYNLARIQESEGKTQDAIKSYEQLLKIKPDDYESTYKFGEFLYKKGYLSKSLTYLNKIPNTSEYKSKAGPLIEKIKKRQIELSNESKIKAEQKLKTSLIQNISAPSGIVVNSKSEMFVASFTENKIIKISKDNTQKTTFADKTKGLNGPIGMAIDSYNNIYVANYNSGTIVLLDENGNSQILMYTKKPYCINLDEKSNKIYITEQHDNSVISFDITDVIQNSMKKAKLEVKPVSNITEPAEKKVITVPVTDKNPIGTPSIQESNFTKGNPKSSITAPIMVPSVDLFD